MARRKLLNPDECQSLLGIPDNEESLIRHDTLSPHGRLQADMTSVMLNRVAILATLRDLLLK